MKNVKSLIYIPAKVVMGKVSMLLGKLKSPQLLMAILTINMHLMHAIQYICGAKEH